MFNIATMKTALFGQIGFRNSDDPCINDLASTLTTSVTGEYFDGYHPLVTIENLMSIAPNYDGYNAAAWAAGTTYGIGILVKQSEVTWESVQAANTGHDPDADDGTWWKLPINDWLTQKVNASISKVLNRVFTNKKLMESSKTLLENIQLFDGSGRFQDTITPLGRFVGLQITPKKINNIVLSLDYIGLQFTQIQTALKIYVFHSSRESAIKTQEITTLVANSFHWEAGDSVDLDYVDYTNHIDSGGSFYVGYFEDDITGNAIKKRHQFADPPCGGCSNTDWDLYNLWNKFFDVRPIEIASGDLNGTSLWDTSKTGYQFSNNFGMNLSISAKTDVTDILKSNKTVFTDALGYQFAHDMLQEMLVLPPARLNRLGDNAQKAAIFFIQELNENETLTKRLDETVSGLTFDLSRLSQVLPKDTVRRLKIGAI